MCDEPGDSPMLFMLAMAGYNDELERAGLTAKIKVGLQVKNFLRFSNFYLKTA